MVSLTTYTKIDQSYLNGDQYMVFGNPKPDGTFDIYAMHKISNSLGYDQEIEGRVKSLDENQKIATLESGLSILMRMLYSKIIFEYRKMIGLKPMVFINLEIL